MKDFDADLGRKERAEQDRSFTVSGRTFVRRVGVRPEVLEEYSRTRPEDATAAGFELLDRLFFALVEAEGHDAWREIRADEENPITYTDLKEVCAWLVREETGRPIEAPSSSTPGRESSGTTLTGKSSPLEAVG